jgi:pilus assembly protein CpaE
MVGMLDALSLKDTKLGFETLELMGCDVNRVLLVLNRSDSKIGITREDAEKILGRTPDVLVPSDREIPMAVTEGRPIVLSRDGSQAARSFRKLAGFFVEEQAPSARQAKEAKEAKEAASQNGDRPHKRRGPISALLRRH